MALLVVPEWANIYHSIEEGPAWIASMILSAVLVTLGYFTWHGARWAKMTIIIFISLATLVKVLSFVSGGFNRDAVLALSSVVAGLALVRLILPKGGQSPPPRKTRHVPRDDPNAWGRDRHRPLH